MNYTASDNLHYYSDEKKFLVATDCVIFGFEVDKLKVLFQRRTIEPNLGCPTPLGGFVKDDESVDDAAYRILNERTGIKNIYLSQVETFGAIDRDPGARVISVVYCALIDKLKHSVSLMNRYQCQWYDIDRIPELYFDHSEMVEKALAYLRDAISHSPIALNLLPRYFTLTNLQKLYESILGRELDKRNFRKRIGEMPYFVKTDRIDKSSSKRGACLYTFDKKMYRNIGNFHI